MRRVVLMDRPSRRPDIPVSTHEMTSTPLWICACQKIKLAPSLSPSEPAARICDAVGQKAHEDRGTRFLAHTITSSSQRPWLTEGRSPPNLTCHNALWDSMIPKP